jgi:hypothetical protein
MDVLPPVRRCPRALEVGFMTVNCETQLGDSPLIEAVGCRRKIFLHRFQYVLKAFTDHIQSLRKAREVVAVRRRTS